MADLNAKYLAKFLTHHGFIHRTDMTAQFAGISGEDIGRADMFAARNGKAVNIEAKQGSTGFMMSNWRENQREWARWTSGHPFNITYWIFLTLGEHPATYNPEKYLPKKTWLLPFNVMIDAENKIIEYQKTLPMRVGKGMNKVMQEKKLDAITLFSKYELVWSGAGTLVKPEWMMRIEELENVGKTQEVIERSKMYGGFWVAPKTHLFYQMFIEGTEIEATV